MTATEYLLQPRALDRMIWRLTLQRDELQSCLLPRAIRYDADKVQVSPEDAFSATAAAVADLDARIGELLRRKAELVQEVAGAIEQLEDDRERVVLTAYYVARLPMETIADRIGYSLPHTYRLRRRGAEHLQEVRGET